MIQPIGGATTHEAIRNALTAIPKIDLGVGITPLEHLPRLSRELGGPKIFIKRDDIAGGPLGGNKTRMLEYVMAKAIAAGSTAVVGGSAVQSNYSRQLAAACARLGLDCHLVLRQIRPEDEQVQGSLLLDYLYGAKVHLVHDDRDLQTRRLNELAESLERGGDVVYRAPQASEADKPLHALAYVDAALELIEQAADAGFQPTHVYVSSLDTTHAGMLLGLRAGAPDATLHAISPNESAIFPDRTIADEVARLATACAAMLGVSMSVAPSTVQTCTSFVGERYGAVTPGALAAMRLFARSEAIVLDPVYSAKAAAALIEDVRTGELGKDDVVVFWHTGGMPAVFAYAAEIAAEFVDR
jgi:1-aminocyclopropane-1-carboxylate deaminase/D-cysteine desulfhydrase-like pyridoxal-dependent ACC family enzyme